MTAADHATAVQLVRAAAADHLTHLHPDERDELVERITGALDRCAAKAWDEGWQACWQSVLIPASPVPANPYREAE